jgi:CHC2 zinc finger
LTAVLVPLDELRRRISLVALVGRRISLARRGREFVALCPFHHEKTPSFYVVEDKGFYHCFGCGAHGEHISFVMRYDNLDRDDAVEKLASEVGLDRSKASRQRPDVASRRPPPAADKEQIWVPVLPVPKDAPLLLRPDGRTIELINPKQAGTRKERVAFGRSCGGHTAMPKVCCSASCCAWNFVSRTGRAASGHRRSRSAPVLAARADGALSHFPSRGRSMDWPSSLRGRRLR